MSKIFLVKSFVEVNAHTLEDMLVVRGLTRFDIETAIKEGLDEHFGDSDEYEFIDSFYTQKDDVDLGNFHIQEIGEVEAVALEKFVGTKSFGYGLLSYIEIK